MLFPLSAVFQHYFSCYLYECFLRQIMECFIMSKNRRRTSPAWWTQVSTLWPKTFSTIWKPPLRRSKARWPQRVLTVRITRSCGLNVMSCRKWLERAVTSGSSRPRTGGHPSKQQHRPSTQIGGRIFTIDINTTWSGFRNLVFSGRSGFSDLKCT